MEGILLDHHLPLPLAVFSPEEMMLLEWGLSLKPCKTPRFHSEYKISIIYYGEV